MKEKLSNYLLSIFVITILTTSATAQHTNAISAANGNDVGASQRSYLQARRVLDEGIEAMGGVDALRGIKDFTLKEKGRNLRSLSKSHP
jgi:hypothetical protein